MCTTRTRVGYSCCRWGSVTAHCFWCPRSVAICDRVFVCSICWREGVGVVPSPTIIGFVCSNVGERGHLHRLLSRRHGVSVGFSCMCQMAPPITTFMSTSGPAHGTVKMQRCPTTYQHFRMFRSRWRKSRSPRSRRRKKPARSISMCVLLLWSMLASVHADDLNCGPVEWTALLDRVCW